MATFNPVSDAALLTNQVLTPSMVGWSMASKIPGRSVWNSWRVTMRVVCSSPRSRAKRSASGASSCARPCSASKATVTVRGGCPAAAASAVSAVESMPDERNAPTGTSDTRW